MARRITPAQARSKLRQAQQRQRQAVDHYNSAVRKRNRDVKRAVDEYNRRARAHNAQVRANQQRLRREISKLKSTPTTTRFVIYRESVVTLRRSFSRIESAADAGSWSGGEELFDLVEGETANSVGVLNALLGDETSTDQSSELSSLQTSSIATELVQIGHDLDDRWRGALFALNPNNPDAARHFCTSAREILTTILETEAPDEKVIAKLDNYETTPEGGVARRARVRYCLERRGTHDSELVTFVEEDINNVIALFRDFNAGTHGSTGRFNMPQLTAIKHRVEDAIRFLHRILR